MNFTLEENMKTNFPDVLLWGTSQLETSVVCMKDMWIVICRKAVVRRVKMTVFR